MYKNDDIDDGPLTQVKRLLTLIPVQILFLFGVFYVEMVQCLVLPNLLYLHALQYVLLSLSKSSLTS